MLFALAAEEAKLEVVALMSGWNLHPAHPTIHTREHWIANNIYRWMPTVNVIYVNPGIFAFMYLLGLPAIVHFGMLVGPWGDGLNAPPSSEDIGSVAAGVLADPSPHIGKRYRPTGPKLISPHDMADILTDVVGRKVKYHDTSVKMFLKAAKAQGVSAFEIGHIGYYSDEIRGGTYAAGAPTDHVQEITGRPPESFETIARRYIAHPDLIAPGLTGPKLISPHDMADILTDVVGRKVKYHDTSVKMFLKAAKAQGVSAFEIGHIGYYSDEIRGGTYAAGAPTDHVQEITGRPPESFETIARRYIAHPDLIAPGLRAGTKLEALAFMVKMMLTRAPNPDRWARERDHPMLEKPVLAHDSREWRKAAEKTESSPSADFRRLVDSLYGSW